MASASRAAAKRQAGSERRRGLRTLAVALLLVALGFAAGRLAAPPSQPAAAPASPIAQAPPPVVLRPPAPSDSDTEPTRIGAARAAARALSSLADARLLTDQERRRAVVAEIARPAYRAQIAPVFDRTYQYLAATLGEAVHRGEAVLRMTPVGYRIESFSGPRATVAVWQVTLLATPERAPIAAWSTSRAELAWAGGRWRVERFGVDAPGPTPSVTAPATPTAAGEFVALADGLTPFAP